MRGNQGRLNALGRVDTWIAERIKPLEWLISDVLAYFPVFVADIGDGLYVDVWDFDPATPAELYIQAAAPGDHRYTPVYGGGYERCAPISWSSRSRANVITVRGHLAASGGYFTTQLWSGDPTDAGTFFPAVTSPAVTTRNHPYLAQSFALFGRNELDVQVPTVSDPPTLDRIAHYLTVREALPAAEVGYIIPWRKRNMRPGMRVSVTDDGLGLDGAPGVVSGYRYTDGQLQVRVSLLPR